MTHMWIGRRYLPERYGQECRVLRSCRGKHLVQFLDGWHVVTVRGTFRRLPVEQSEEKGEGDECA